MSSRLDVHQYLAGREELRRRELVWGVLHDPPAPWCDHQAIVTRALVLLATHVSTHALGRILVSPVDVVLDAKNGLIVQPDIVFVARDRLEIVTQQIWGAPDLVVEVLSPGTRRRDLTNKREWYRQYGVREYWIVDWWAQTVQVLSFGGAQPESRRTANETMIVTSDVLAGFGRPAADFFQLD